MAGTGATATARPIVIRPAAVLTTPATPVLPPDAALEALVAELWATMATHRGLGLAAPQIGVPQRVAVVEVAGDRLVLLNPRVVRTRGHQAGWEGCLSVPGLVAQVERADDVEVETLTLGGSAVRHRVRGLLARAVLHEVDHLDGRLYTDLVPEAALVDTVANPTPPTPGSRGAGAARSGGRR